MIENLFWAESINNFLEPLSTDHPPLWFLILTPCLVLLSIPIAYYLFVKKRISLLNSFKKQTII